MYDEDAINSTCTTLKQAIDVQVPFYLLFLLILLKNQVVDSETNKLEDIECLRCLNDRLKGFC